jgi:Domain of unknown function (DUF4398)
MLGGSRVLLLVIFILSIGCGACGEPPEKEMQQAEAAVAAARAAGADEYAHDEFVAAQDALKRAHDAVADHDYRLALNNALDSRERADNATKLAADQRQAARAEAERTVAAAVAALSSAQARLKAAEAAHTPRRTLSGPRRTIDAATERVQEARAAIQKGDYVAATKGASSVMSELTSALRDLEVVPASPPRRRR